jgi:hypothetical protein
MKAVGDAAQNIKRLEVLVEQLESLHDGIYEEVICDDGEIIERAHVAIREMKSNIKRLEEIKLEEYNEVHSALYLKQRDAKQRGG